MQLSPTKLKLFLKFKEQGGFEPYMIIPSLKQDYIQNGTHHSGMWGCFLYYVSLNVVGQGLVLLHFLSKDFEILDLDPPNNPTSHYGACHFGYNLALRIIEFNVPQSFWPATNTFLTLISFHCMFMHVFPSYSYLGALD